MKKFGTCMTLAFSAICFLALLNPMKALADPITVSLELENVGPGNNSGGVYTYPYNFSVNGSTELTSLMCYVYYDEIYEGETWTATVLPITTVPEEELAYLFSVADDPNSSATTVSAAQWAAWELFDPSLTTAPDGPGQTAVTDELDAAVAFVSTANPDFYSGYDLYVPIDGSQNPLSDGEPQSFIGTAVTPEPSSLFLFGTGLLVFAGAIFRKRLTAQRVTHTV